MKATVKTAPKAATWRRFHSMVPFGGIGWLYLHGEGQDDDDQRSKVRRSREEITDHRSEIKKSKADAQAKRAHPSSVGQGGQNATRWIVEHGPTTSSLFAAG